MPTLDFAAIDFETGQYAPESALSVGIVKFIAGREVATYYSLLRPLVLEIRPDFTEIHGLTVVDVADAPTFAQVWASEILPFIDGLPLAAHNASFDMRVLASLLAYYHLALPPLDAFCTLRLARLAWKGLPSYRLTALAEHFAIRYKAHNALEDARTCGVLVCRAAVEAGCGDTRSLLAAMGLAMLPVSDFAPPTSP
jgi:DNA polymerase-3 subunit epsilon